MQHAELFLILACVFGLIMAWGVGANDVANAMGTSVGSKSLTLKQAVVIATIFECLGALLVGGQVTNTIRSSIINPASFQGMPEVVVMGMLAALLAAGVWLVIASIYGWPVSTTHSIIGAIIGFGAVRLGVESIYWGNITNIFLSWILTPAIACVIAYALFRSVQYLILNAKNPVEAAKHYVPFYIFIAALIISMVTFEQGLHHIGLEFEFFGNLIASIMFSAFVAFIGMLMLRRVHLNPTKNYRFDYRNVETIFSILMIFTACAMAFAHGSNDVANAIGPLAAVVSIVTHNGDVNATGPVPLWILGLGATGIVLGLLMYGYRVIDTIGSEITELTPSRGFAATLATAGTVVVASGTGLPISTTQTLVGAILGVGLARGIGAIRLEVIRNIFLSWMITLPAGAVLAIIFFYLLENIFK